MAFIKEDITAKFLSAESEPIECLHTELHFHKKKKVIKLL